MKRFLFALALTLAAILGLAAPSHAAAPAVPIRPAASGASYTTCDQSSVYNDRVCIDRTTGFGPIVYIYSASNSLLYTFTVHDCSGVSSRVYSASEWVFGTSTATWTAQNPHIIDDVTTLEGDCHQSQTFGVNSTANHNLLEWYANTADYELIVAQ